MDEGTIILLDYEGWTGEPAELFDTTKEELAKEHELHEEQRTYAPMVTVIGGGRLVEGLEEHLKEAEVGKDYEVVIPAEKAYGPRDPKQIKLHKKNEVERHLREQADRTRQPPMPLMEGVEIEMDGKHGHIVLVTGSRVRIDFNHHLAGKDLTFKYKVTEAVDDAATKVEKVIRLEYPVESDFDIDVDDQNIARISLPDICKYDSNWFGAKMRIVASLRKWADVTDVHFIESYTAPPPAPEDEEGGEEKAEEAGEEKEAEAPAEESGAEEEAKAEEAEAETKEE